MKRRFRYYIRSGWHIVDLPEIKDPRSITDDQKQYIEMRSWCNENVTKHEWEATLHAGSGTPNPNHKRFAFKNIEDKLLFVLRWS